MGFIAGDVPGHVATRTESHLTDRRIVPHSHGRKRFRHLEHAQLVRYRQVEEEDNARTIIDQLKMVEGNSVGLYMIDKELAARTYTVPAPLANSAQ